MASWFVRIALVRFLGRRILWFLMVYDLFRVLLAARRAWMKPKTRRES